MPLNATLVGTTYAEVPFDVEPDRVAAFARVVGHPFDDVPPTFAVVPEFAAGLHRLLDDDELGLELSAVLHGDEAYTWHRPLRVGERLVAVSTLEEIRGRGGTSFVTVRTDLRDVEGNIVVVARSTLVVRDPT